MALFGQVLGQLELPPGVIQDILRVLGVDCVEFPLRGGVGHKGANEKLGESVQGLREGIAGYFEMVVGLLLRRIGIRLAEVLGDELNNLKHTVE